MRFGGAARRLSGTTRRSGSELRGSRPILPLGKTVEPRHDTGSARDAFRQAAEAGSQDVPQVAQRPMLRASARLEPQAVTASNLFLDTPFDSSLAPDLQQMLALTSDDARYTVGITLDTNALIEGDVVMTFVNTDGNAAASAWSAGGRPTPGAAATAGRRSRGRRS